MSSKLVGLKKTLAWTNFLKKFDKQPAPGTLTPGAETQVIVAFSNKNAPTTVSGSGFTLEDSITVTVSLNPKNWVQNWVFKKPALEQAALLKHEQGHYDLAALVTRDYFIDIMDMKNWEYTSTAEVDLEYQQLKTDMRTKTVAVQKLYEAETANGTIADKQKDWDGFIQKAFTEVRGTGEKAPDGVFYKKKLVDILKGAGKVI